MSPDSRFVAGTHIEHARTDVPALATLTVSQSALRHIVAFCLVGQWVVITHFVHVARLLVVSRGSDGPV